MTEKHFIVATAGHVDHGKSTLVKILTGTDPDRLPEEKARKITIDLGFAELNLVGPDDSKFHLGIVDVPGHEDFVRNMVAGVGSIDLALLVVAADDGWMPQTEEHLQILNYLGVTRAVIALTKTDIADGKPAEKQIRERLANTSFADAPIVHTSVHPAFEKAGSIPPDGIENLKNALLSALVDAEAPKDIGKPRLAVDRVFGLRGIGTVVTGTLTGGILRAGDTIVVQPRGAHGRIRSLQTHNRNLSTATPGTRTALNLPDLSTNGEIVRGDVITVDGFEPSTRLDVVLNRFAHGQRAAIKSGTSCYLHHGTTRAVARIVLMEHEPLRPGNRAFAQLRLSSPLLAFVGDRFVLRDGSEKQTIAGGIVLDLDGEHFRLTEERALLSARATGHDNPELCVATEAERSGVLEISSLLRRSRFSEDRIAEAIERLEQSGQIVVRGSIAATTAHWRDLCEQAGRLIDAAHKAHPESPGLELNELRPQLNSAKMEIFDALIADLGQQGFVCTGSKIARRSHQPELPTELRPIKAQILGLISAKPFDPPSRKLLAADSQSQKVVRFLIERGEIFEIGNDIIFSREAFDRAKDIISTFISRNGAASVSELRQSLQTSRRVIVPLLERLDRDRVTQRVGDQRTLIEKL